MKILFSPAHYVYDETNYGSEFTSTYELVDRLCNLFPNSVVITGKRNILSNKDYKIYEVSNKINYNMDLLSAIKFNVAYTLLSTKILVRNKPNLIHHVRPFVFGSTFNLIPILNLNKNIPFIIGPFCSAYKPKGNGSFFQKLTARILKTLSVMTIRHSDIILVYDKYTKNTLSKYISPNKIIIITPGKDGSKFRYVHNYKKKNIRLISVGYLTKRKGFDLLIRSFKEIIEKVPQVHLTIVGCGEELENLKSQVCSLKIEENVTFTGKVSNREIPKYYANSDLFVSMQREESFGQVYIEAMASGLPIVTTRTIGSSTIIKDEFGILVGQGDVKGFSKVVCDLLNKPNKLLRMSKNSRKDFENSYDWEKSIIPKYLKLYRSILR